MSNLIVFDLDGTLANPVKEGPSFAIAMPLATVFRLYAYDGRYTMNIWTGRTESQREETEDWLSRTNLNPYRLHMRATNDRRPERKIKKQWLDEMVTRPAMVYEDSHSVARMVRGYGVPCCDVGGNTWLSRLFEKGGR